MTGILVKLFQFKIPFDTPTCYSQSEIGFAGHIFHPLENLWDVITISSFSKTYVF